MKRLFAGIDVGGKRKGFHIAVLDADPNVVDQFCETDPPVAAALLEHREVAVVAVDSPIDAANSGKGSRDCERRFRTDDVCGIRFTPDMRTIRAENRTDYYGWINNGLALYDALKARTRHEHWEVIECFPTATWTRLDAGRPSGVSRAAWSRRVLGKLHLDPLPPRMNQDQRDALGAAYTAWLHGGGETDLAFEPIVIPREIH